MEFLKDVLGEELFKQVEEYINTYNWNDGNKEKIKVRNLGSGDYVSKGKYDTDLQKVQSLLDAKGSELEAANGLISDLKKETKTSGELQEKIAEYEKAVTDLTAERTKLMTDSALKSLCLRRRLTMLII